MTRATYSDDTKAAVMAALLAGQSITAVAKEYHIHKGTVHAWKNRLPAGDLPDQKREIGDLLIEYLRTNLTTLRVQAETFADKTWLKKQGASELGVLHGILADKTVRLLEAMSRSESNG